MMIRLYWNVYVYAWGDCRRPCLPRIERMEWMHRIAHDVADRIRRPGPPADA